MNNRNFSPPHARRVRQAFTLIEVLVALGILAILLVIIVLPLRLGFDSFNKGNAQNLTQSAVQSTLTDMGNDIRDSVYVFPNSRVAGVTDQPPYVNKDAAGNVIPTDSTSLPYYLSTDNTDLAEPGKGAVGNPNGIACSTNSKPGSNPARLDMIQVRRDAFGSVLTPLAPSYNIVSYYARRQQLDRPYDPIDNPVVMYRAEYPAFGLVNNAPNPLQVQSPAGAFNAKIDFKRVTSASADCTTNSAVGNRSSLWLSHNYLGEADLLPLTQIGKTNAPTAFQQAANYDVAPSTYSQTLVTPRGLALEATNAYRSIPGYTPPAGDTRTPEGSLIPDTAFTTTDTNGDGKIDRVTISLGLASFNAGAQGQLDPVTKQPVGTVLRDNLTVDLPNIK